MDFNSVSQKNGKHMTHRLDIKYVKCERTQYCPFISDHIRPRKQQVSLFLDVIMLNPLINKLQYHFVPSIRLREWDSFKFLHGWHDICMLSFNVSDISTNLLPQKIFPPQIFMSAYILLLNDADTWKKLPTFALNDGIFFDYSICEWLSHEIREDSVINHLFAMSFRCSNCQWKEVGKKNAIYNLISQKTDG